MIRFSPMLCVLSRLAILWLIAPFVFGQYRIVFDDDHDVFAISPDGTQLKQLTRTTDRSQAPQSPHRKNGFASWSPDHTQIVFASNMDGGSETDIYVMHADGSNVRRLTNQTDESFIAPVRSPADGRIAFHSWNEKTRIGGLYVMNSDGGDIRRLDSENIRGYYPSWSPDGKLIAFTGYVLNESETNTDIYVMEADGSNIRRLTESPGSDQAPDWSPDGRSIAFDSTRDGNFEIYVMNAHGSNQRRLTNHYNVDSRPSWSPDGRQIVFNSSRNAPDKTEENAAGYSTYEIYVMDADGSNIRRLTFNDKFEGHPDW